MKTWRSAVLPLRCGFRGCAIGVGEAYLEIHGVTWRKVRCVEHAGEPVNHAQLAAQVPAKPQLSLVKGFESAGAISQRVDWKTRAAGE